MELNEDFDDEQITRALERLGSVRSDTRFRQHLLESTVQILRRQQRSKLIGRLLAMAACYVAGLVTMRLVSPLQQTTELAAVGPTAIALDSSAVSAEQQAEEQTNAELPAAVLERMAELATDESFRDLYRRAGDGYMQQSIDLAAALRCYREALRFAPPQNLVVRENDNWLLASLKQAHLEEYEHAIHGG